MVGVLGEGQGAGKRWARGHHVGREQRPRYMEGAGGQDGVRESLAGAPSPVPPVINKRAVVPAQAGVAS